MRTRDVHLDNLKGLLIILVVFGHLIEPFVLANAGHTQRSAYVMIYLVHMPLFAAVSGYLSRTTFSRQAAVRIIRELIVPYLIFHFAFIFFDVVVHGAPFTYQITTPYWVLYFLLCLAIWRMVLPCWIRLRFPLIAAISLSLIAGMIDEIGYYLSLSRLFYFFPFFVLGAQLKAAQITFATLNRFFSTGVSILLIGGSFIYGHLPAAYDINWLYGSFSYARLGYDAINGALIRMAHYAATTVLAIAVIASVPMRKTWLAAWGAATLPIYLFHGFIVKLLFAQSALIYLPQHLILPTMIMLTGVICFVLTRPPFGKLLDTMVVNGDPSPRQPKTG